jgi:protein BCP1
MLNISKDFTNVDVEFEFFDPQPAVDFHGLKNLCRQLFDADAQLFNLSALVDLILSQPTLGSTIKVDGNESDPYAFLSVINLRQHQVCTVSWYELGNIYEPSLAKRVYRAFDPIP